jgi:hypothetical protein
VWFFSNWIHASSAKIFSNPSTTHAGMQPQEWTELLRPRPFPRNKLPLQTGSNTLKQEASSPALCDRHWSVSQGLSSIRITCYTSISGCNPH